MILQYNLQFFAKDGPGGERTEPATEKKLSDARKEGQVAKSKEIANCMGILSLVSDFEVLCGNYGHSSVGDVSGGLQQYSRNADLLGRQHAPGRDEGAV